MELSVIPHKYLKRVKEPLLRIRSTRQHYANAPAAELAAGTSHIQFYRTDDGRIVVKFGSEGVPFRVRKGGNGSFNHTGITDIAGVYALIPGQGELAGYYTCEKRKEFEPHGQ